MKPISKVIVLGGGSAGFMAALALKLKVPHLDVRVIHSSDLGIIGVGEGSTVALTRFLHDYLRLSPVKFFEVARSWLADHDNSSVTRQQLYDHWEAETGLELTAFFAAWITGRRTPPAGMLGG